jgi:cytochrome P450 RapN
MAGSGGGQGSTHTQRAVAYPFAPEIGLEVDGRYRELQRTGPFRAQLAYGPECWLATSYDDVKAVHGDRRFCKELGAGKTLPRTHPMPPLDPSLLANMDPPRHTRIRKLATSAFAKPRIRDMRGWVDGLIDEILDGMLANGPGVDLNTMAYNLPNHVLTGILGVPRSCIPAFRRPIETMLNPQSSGEVRLEAMADLKTYILELIAERRRHPTDDLLSELVHARDHDDRLDDHELVMLAMTLFLGGFETTMAQLSDTMFVLLSQRNLWEELLADRSLLPAAFEELWRWVPSIRYGGPLARWAAEDVELSNGVVIPQGDIIIGERSVANRDEAVFPSGWEIDFHRVDPAPHLALGWGVHHCVGAHLAHLEIELTLEKLLDRLPTLELAVPADQIIWSGRTMLRSPETLPITW